MTVRYLAYVNDPKKHIKNKKEERKNAGLGINEDDTNHMLVTRDRGREGGSITLKNHTFGET